MIGKKAFFLIFIAVLTIYCNNEEVNENKKGKPVILIENKIFDFGEIQRGEILAHTFIVKNIGNGELVISKVEADCGCTIIDFDREPIKPNEESNIEILFDSEGLAGLQIKKLNVYSNSNSKPVELVISANVKYQLEEGI